LLSRHFCFMAGANSIFGRREAVNHTQTHHFDEDMAMFELLGLTPRKAFKKMPAGAFSNKGNELLMKDNDSDWKLEASLITDNPITLVISTRSEKLIHHPTDRLV